MEKREERTINQSVLPKIFTKKEAESKFSKEILDAQMYFQNEKFDFALNSLNLLTQEQIEELPEKMQFIYHKIKGTILMITENLQEAIDSAEKSFQIGLKLKDSIEKIDSFLLLAEILQIMGNFQRSSEILEETEKLIQNLPKKFLYVKKDKRGEFLRIKAWVYLGQGKLQETVEFLEEMVEIYNNIGNLAKLAGAYTFLSSPYAFLGELDKSLSYVIKADEIFSKIKKLPFVLINWQIGNYIMYGMIYSMKGDLIKAVNFTKQALQLAKKNNLKMTSYLALNNLGCQYLLFADWDNAIKCFEESLAITQNFGNPSGIVTILDGIFLAHLYKNDLKSAESCLDRIKQINEIEDNKTIDLTYQLAKALLLRKSTRTRDLGEAQDILKEITKEEVIHVEMTIRAMVNLSEMLLIEFKESKDSEILNETKPIIDRLFKTAEDQGSYLVMGETLLLKSKLALISLDLISARQYLSQGQIIAEKYGLNNLSIKISNENDELIKNLGIWEKMQSENASINERLDKINVDKQIDSMLHKIGFEEPEIHNEDPVLVMIMTESGIPLYTKIFDEQWSVNEELFSGFLSAFNSFSDEIFSKGFDRAVFGDYSILMKHISPFMISYIFLGQSYLAKQRFSKFTENIQKTESIITKLNHSLNTGLVLKSRDVPNLENMMSEIFISKKI